MLDPTDTHGTNQNTTTLGGPTTGYGPDDGGGVNFSPSSDSIYSPFVGGRLSSPAARRLICEGGREAALRALHK